MNGLGGVRWRRGRELGSDSPGKSASLDSPAANRIVSEIKVRPLWTHPDETAVLL